MLTITAATVAITRSRREPWLEVQKEIKALRNKARARQRQPAVTA